jgi:hypothetical protein
LPCQNTDSSVQISLFTRTRACQQGLKWERRLKFESRSSAHQCPRPALICTMLWTEHVRNLVLSARDNVYRLLHSREIQENINLYSLAEPSHPSTDTSLSDLFLSFNLILYVSCHGRIMKLTKYNIIQRVRLGRVTQIHPRWTRKIYLCSVFVYTGLLTKYPKNNYKGA